MTVLWLVSMLVTQTERPVVTLASSEPVRAVAARLEAELGGRGFVVTPVGVEALVFEPAALQATLERSDASSLVAVRRPSGGGVEVWVVDGKTRQVVVRTARTPAEELLLAVDVAELVRVGSLTRSMSAASTTTPVAAVPAPPPEPEPARVPGALGLGLMTTLSPGGVSPLLLGQLRLGLVVGSRFEPSLELGGALVPGRLAGDGFTMSLSLVRALVRAGLRVPLASRLTLVLVGAGGAAFFTAAGVVSAPRVGQTRTLLSGIGATGVELEWQLFSRVALRPAARVEVMGPYPQLTAEGQPVASFGAPAVSFGAEVQVALW